MRHFDRPSSTALESSPHLSSLKKYFAYPHIPIFQVSRPQLYLPPPWRTSAISFRADHNPQAAVIDGDLMPLLQPRYFRISVTPILLKMSSSLVMAHSLSPSKKQCLAVVLKATCFRGPSPFMTTEVAVNPDQGSPQLGQGSRNLCRSSPQPCSHSGRTAAG